MRASRKVGEVRAGVAVALLAFIVAGVATGAAAQSFTTWESGQVRPLALSPDGDTLYAVNTPDDRLEIFDVTAAGLAHRGSVPVGVEPVAVAARGTEVWVVNHLSDSVSVVDVSSDPPRVVRTLLVGDEPRDIVFAGPSGNRAFITTAHRGQQRTHSSIAAVPGAGDPQLTTAGIGRADVWVFDATSLGSTLGGTPLRIVTLFGDTPRALATSPDGNTVYAAVFKSGNQSTVVAEPVVCNGFDGAPPCVVDGASIPGGLPGPDTNFAGANAPETALIVRYDAASDEWRDPLGRDWSNAVMFDLPDHDVFAIDATTLAQTDVFNHVGTTIFNIAVNPATDAVYVSNTEARNEVRFEGPGVFGGSTVQGHLAESRISVLTPSGVFPRHLNKHIDYNEMPAAIGVKDHSLATPVGMVVSPDGTTLYVAAFGSSRIGVFDTAALEGDSFQPETASADYLTVSGGGPSGLVLDTTNQRLYVLTRFDNAISVVDLGTSSETAHLALHNPEPSSVVEGRPFLYDAFLTSSNGEASCSSCHIFGDMDDLAWDLGNPDDPVTTNPIPINLAIAITSGVFVLPAPINGTGNVRDFHPMKGPMTTQTLRGMEGSGAMHWRGDRSTPPGNAGSAFSEEISFNNFNVAFPGLVGRDEELSTADMQKFTDFALQIMLPPNPVRALDNALNAAQQGGHDFYLGPRLSDGIAGTFLGQQLGFTCEGCHRLQPELGHFGTDGRASFENEQQIIKIPHLRNMYQKVGMFGGLDTVGTRPLNLPHMGPQIRGFGFLHDGSVDTLFRFFNADVFSNNAIGGPNVGFQSDTQRRNMEQFMLAFDTNFAPIVAQQITLTGANIGVVGTRLDLLVARAGLGECELIVKGVQNGEQRGWVRVAGGALQSDRAAEAPVAEATLRASAGAGEELTYTCVPAGSGTRAGVDRDEDGYYDRDELDASSDPTDPSSTPDSLRARIRTTSFSMKDDATVPIDPSKRRLTFTSVTKNAPQPNRVIPTVPGSLGDPTIHGATLLVYNSSGLTNDVATINLPASGWSSIGGSKGWKFRATSGAVKTLIIKTDRIVLRGGTGAFGYSLDEAAQGRVAVQLRLGTDPGWCAEATPKLSGSPPSSANSDRPGLFKGLRHGPPPALCPPIN